MSTLSQIKNDYDPMAYGVHSIMSADEIEKQRKANEALIANACSVGGLYISKKGDEFSPTCLIGDGSKPNVAGVMPNISHIAVFIDADGDFSMHFAVPMDTPQDKLDELVEAVSYSGMSFPDPTSGTHIFSIQKFDADTVDMPGVSQDSMLSNMLLKLQAVGVKSVPHPGTGIGLEVFAPFIRNGDVLSTDPSMTVKKRLGILVDSMGPKLNFFDFPKNILENSLQEVLQEKLGSTNEFRQQESPSPGLSPRPRGR